MITLSNSVNLVGNLGKDVQLTTFKTGGKKASFSLATSQKFKNYKGEDVINTIWHNIIAWGKNAELLANSLTKGNKVAITGTITNRMYEDKDGHKKSITEILVVDFMKINHADKRELAVDVKDPKPF
ncbi:MAG: hypothetical protein RLZZ546_3289 [Bacteroidota bacterium]|jgi:single-strand DNA-binding protein